MALNRNLDPSQFLSEQDLDNGITVLDFLDNPPINYEFDTVDQRFEITPEYEYQLDKIAYETLGQESLDWVLWVANDNLIHLPEDVVSGKVIDIPPVSDVTEFRDEFRRSATHD